MKVRLVLIAIAIISTIHSFAFSGEELNRKAGTSTSSEKVYPVVKLSTTAQADLIKTINEAKAKYNFDSKNFIITKTNQSNGSQFALQVEDFLLEKGTKVQAYGTKSLQLKGYTIIKNETCFEIIIGVL